MTLPMLCQAVQIQKAFELRSSKGITVKIVAIYKAEPDGLSFSPHPNAALIGSTKLRTIKTPWENVDLSSLTPYPELVKAYNAAINGQSTTLNIGPEFTNLDEVKREISSNIPICKVSTIRKISYELLLSDKDTFQRFGNKATTREANKLKEQWLQIAIDLEAIDYQPAASQLAHSLKKASKGIESLARSGNSFNITAGRDISNLFNLL